jgi:hypothetical protein
MSCRGIFCWGSSVDASRVSSTEGRGNKRLDLFRNVKIEPAEKGRSGFRAQGLVVHSTLMSGGTISVSGIIEAIVK